MATEAALQRQVADLLEVMLPRDPDSVRRSQTVWTAFPAGGGGAVRGAILKGMGLQAGWPDIVILSKGKFYGIELKTAKGQVSAAQKDCHRLITFSDGHVFVARSLDDVAGFVRAIVPGARKVKPLFDEVLP